MRMGPRSSPSFLSFFFFNDTATTEIYTLSLHDALPISSSSACSSYSSGSRPSCSGSQTSRGSSHSFAASVRSEEHTSELQSLAYLVCRLLLEKKNFGRRPDAIFTCTHQNDAVR